MEWTGPNRERWVCIWAPVTAATGLGDVHPTWGSVFVAEPLAVLFPAAHLLIADHDSAPVSLFEAGQLFRLAQQVLVDVQRLAGATEVPTAGVILCSECRAEVHAGFVLVRRTRSSNDSRPGSDTELANQVIVSRGAFHASQHPQLAPVPDGTR